MCGRDFFRFSQDHQPFQYACQVRKLMINDEFHQSIEILFLDNSTEVINGGGGQVPHFDLIVTNKVQKAGDITFLYYAF